MKQMIKKSILTAITALFLVTAAIAQPPPPEEHGSDGNQPAAPIGSGIAILMSLGVAFGAKKVYDARKRMKAL